MNISQRKSLVLSSWIPIYTIKSSRRSPAAILPDAFLRFKKNKSSLVAAIIILFLLLFAIVSPIISPYTINDKDKVYNSFPPYVPSIAEKGWGILDGAITRGSQNDLSYLYWQGIAKETGMDRCSA